MHVPALLLQKQNSVVVVLFCYLILCSANSSLPPRFRFQNLFDFTVLSSPRGMTITRPDVAWNLKKKRNLKQNSALKLSK